MSGPLKGIKVIELAQIMAGPTCGMLLADMGADVIKVEKLPGGDDTRSYGEPSIKGESAAFMILNRNKRGMAVNLKTTGGLEVVKRLLATADVVTENYRKGTLEKLGLGYDVLQALNPRLIYCAVSGYGRTGPYADKGGFDLIAQGFAGIMSITGEPGGPPAKSGTSIADINAGILAALGIVSALVARSTTGKGQMVETSLMEAAIQQTYWQSAIFFAKKRRRMASRSFVDSEASASSSNGAICARAESASSLASVAFIRAASRSRRRRRVSTLRKSMAA